MGKTCVLVGALVARPPAALRRPLFRGREVHQAVAERVFQLKEEDGLFDESPDVGAERRLLSDQLDKLIEMGLVSDQDAMGARMMMSMFAVPGSEPDTLSSTIEVNEQGHVLANGQRIK